MQFSHAHPQPPQKLNPFPPPVLKTSESFRTGSVRKSGKPTSRELVGRGVWVINL